MPRVIFAPVRRIHLDPRDSRSCRYAKKRNSTRDLRAVNCRVCRRNIANLGIPGAKVAEMEKRAQK